MLIIMVVALIIFGPRKLPKIGKTLGRSIAEFRRTSSELRNTLEREVQMEEFRAARRDASSWAKDTGKAFTGGLDPAGSDLSGANRSPAEASAKVEEGAEAAAGPATASGKDAAAGEERGPAEAPADSPGSPSSEAAASGGDRPPADSGGGTGGGGS